jgi:pilus assembly protein CpaF
MSGSQLPFLEEATVPTIPSVDSSNLPELKKQLSEAVVRYMESAPAVNGDYRREVFNSLYKVYSNSDLNLTETLRDQLFRDVMDDLLGYGPIQPLLEDPNVTEVMVNGPDRVYVEREGKLLKTNIKFEGDDHIRQIIDRIILPLGRSIDTHSPTVDARLPDGSRVNAIIPPVAIDGPSITIRKFSNDRLGIEQLIEFGSLTPPMAQFLHACVVSRLNVVISGGTGSGKTTLLNILSSYLPEDERIVTIEDAAELQLKQEHVVRLETKPENSDGEGKVTIRDLVRNSLRMRPDRIVVGEVRGGEALDMLQAMNTGHDGSLTTLHANTPRDALSRVETMCMMAGLDLPLNVIRQQLASAIDLIVQVSRLRDGTRKVTSITEVAGMEGDTVVMTEVFRFDQTGISEDNKVLGEMKPTGIRPMFMHKLESAGFKLGAEVFNIGIASGNGNNMSNNRRRRR